MDKFRYVPNRGKITNQDFNELTAAVEALKVSGVYPIVTQQDDAGITIALADGVIKAVIVDSGSAPSQGPTCAGFPHSWEEIVPDGAGGWTVVAGGRSGGPGQNPAYEENGNCVTAGTIVDLQPGIQGEYLFSQCCSANDSPFSTSEGNGRTFCIPFVQYVSCDPNRSLIVTLKYLNITLPVGATLEVSDTPCNGSGG